jgi:DNA polymerase-3 subunit gamma/tau
MTYEPLHHKYRPQTFAQLVGQEAIATTLSHALRQQRIAPAYLFTGPRGTGKTSSARILAKSLNCLESDVPTDTPCGTCDTCQMIAKGAALDVIEIDAASNTGVDNIRELIERAQFAPVQCRYKVYIIDEVHMLSTAAFNALLKTLEEPPGRVVFVLATTDPQRVLPTIISRCQRFDYRRIPLDAMVQHLGAIAQTESIDIADEALELVAQIAQGGLRDAESLLDQLSLFDGQISVERVWDLVGAVPERDLLALVQAIAQDDGTTVLDQARHLMNRGREPLVVLQNLASFYRDLLIAKTAGDRRDLVSLTKPTWEALCEFAQTLDMGTILLGQQHLRASEVQVKNTTQPRLWLEITLMGLLPSTLAGAQTGGTVAARPSAPARPMAPASAPTPVGQQPIAPARNPVSAPSPTSTHASPQAQSQGTTPSPQPTSQPQPLPNGAPAPVSDESPAPAPTSASALPPQPPQPISTPEVVVPPEPTTPLANNPGYAAFQQEKLDQTWSQVIAAMKPLAQALLKEHGCLLAFDGKMARVGISSRPLIGIAQSKQRNIEEAFEKVYGTKIVISLEVGTSPTAGQKHSQANVAKTPPPPTPPTTTQNGAMQAPLSLTPAPSSTAPPTPSQPAPSALSTAPPSSSAPPSSASPPSPPATYSEGVPIADEATAPPASPQGWQQEDEVTRAAKSLAQMFNGAIVNLDDEDEENLLKASSPSPDAQVSQSKPSQSVEPSNGHHKTDGSPEALPGNPPVDLDSLPASTRKRPINLDDVPF